jgi:hypothetical protein
VPYELVSLVRVANVVGRRFQGVGAMNSRVATPLLVLRRTVMPVLGGLLRLTWFVSCKFVLGLTLSPDAIEARQMDLVRWTWTWTVLS